MYNVFFEVLYNGATPGKRAVGVKVMNINGTPVGWTGSLLRNLMRFIDFLPGCYAFGCVSVLVSKQFQRLGDLAAGTVVVYQSTKSLAATSINDVEPVPARLSLALDEQQAIVSFGERAMNLNSERAEELAACLEPVFGDVGAATLRANARWLAGGERKT
jgi:hypothetical protein